MLASLGKDQQKRYTKIQLRVVVLIPRITMWTICIRKIEGGGGLRFRTHVDACRCGDGGGVSLLYANVAMTILKGI